MPDITKYITVRVIPGVNINAVADTNLGPVPYTNFTVDKVTVLNASRTLAATTATLGIYSQPAAGGTAFVAAATGSLTPLTSNLQYKDLTITSTNKCVAPTDGLYVRVGVADGAAGTVDVQVTIRRLGP